MAYKRPQKSRVSTHKERERLAQEAKNKDIFAVAQQLGMKVQRDGSAEWDGHTTFWLDRKKNRFQWYSQGLWGDPTTLVSVIQFGARSVEDYKTNYTKSIAYLTNTEVPQFDQSKIPKAAPFKYYLKDAASMQLARDYLIKERKLSPETVQFFEEKGVLTQSVWKNRLDDDSTFTEPVVVFKHFDGNNKMIGGSVQGIEYHPDIHTDHKSGHLKRVIKNSGAYSGLAVDIGQPRRIVVCEAPIDLLSYYELHKETLKDVKLISSDGYKPHVLSRYVAEMYGNPELSTSEKEKFLEKFDKLSKTMSGYPENLITFAYDNDDAGKGFIEQFKTQYPNSEKYTSVDLPLLEEGKNKADWNDYLIREKKENYTMETTNDQEQKNVETEETSSNSRLEIAKRKLERLETELSEHTEKVFAHQRLTNGQPMNDKRSGASFLNKHEQLIDKGIRLNREIEEQRERVERLSYREENAKLGLNASGGLIKSVANLERWEERLERQEFIRAYNKEHRLPVNTPYENEKGNLEYYQSTKLKEAKETVEMLRELKNKAENDLSKLSDKSKELIDNGDVTQWKKRPIYYFVKGLNKVAFELDDKGDFKVSDRYPAKDDKDKELVSKLLDKGAETSVNITEENSINSDKVRVIGNESTKRRTFEFLNKSHDDETITLEMLKSMIRDEVSLEIEPDLGYYKVSTTIGRIDISDGFEANQSLYQEIVDRNDLNFDIQAFYSEISPKKVIDNRLTIEQTLQATRDRMELSEEFKVKPIGNNGYGILKESFGGVLNESVVDWYPQNEVYRFNDRAESLTENPIFKHEFTAAVSEILKDHTEKINNTEEVAVTEGEQSTLYDLEFVSELEKLEAYAEEKGFYLWTRNENWMSNREDDEGEQFLFDEGVYAASAYEYESVEELDEWLLNEEVLISDGLGHTTTFTELKKELLELEATKEKGEIPLGQDKVKDFSSSAFDNKEEINKLELERQELVKNSNWAEVALVDQKLKFLQLEQEVIDTGNPQLIHDQITKIEKEIERREKDAYYSDSWEQSTKIRDDITKLEGDLILLQNLSQNYPIEIAKPELEKNADQQTKTLGEQVEGPSETNTLGADPDINRYEQIIQEQQASLNLLQSQFVELTKQNELIIEKLNQKSVENTEDNQSMKKVGSSTIELAFDQIPRLIQLSKEKLSDVKKHLKDNIKAKSQKGLSVTLEKLKVLEILESINKGLDSLSQKVQNLDTQLKVLSGKQVNEKELLLLPAPIQEAAEEIIQKKNVKIGEPTRPQNKFEERLAQAKKDNKATAENYANQKQEVEVSQRVHK
ncbi:toprim domain-containing protein [Lactococcus petauri]|uniref:toprim domain-containing protein n=1 Tax=Lactococcus petauri TaxID=1940789 RepID=UPI0038540D91